MNPRDDRVTRLLEAGWKLGYLWDRNIDDLTFGDDLLYEPIKIRTSDGQRNWTYQVKSFIGTTQDIEFNHPDTFDKIMSVFE